MVGVRPLLVAQPLTPSAIAVVPAVVPTAPVNCEGAMLGKKILAVPDEVEIVVVVAVVAVELAGPATVSEQVVVLTVPLKVTVALCAMVLMLAARKPSAARPLLKFMYFMLFPLKN